MNPGFHSVPLHHINLKSYFVLGQIIVVVKPMLPVGDISLLFGIDLAGDKAIMDPIIFTENELEQGSA
jgi:hypothetical protein